jgi:hypothetical protein
VFDHRQHVKFAWAVLSELPDEEAATFVAGEIREFADKNAPGRYHETLTRFWVKLVAHTRSVAEESTDFDAHVGDFAVLLDKSAPSKHYSEALLHSAQARSTFVEPDLRPVP